MSCNTALTLSLLLVVLLLSHTSLSMSPFPKLGGLEAQRIRVNSNAIIDLEDPDRLTKRNVNEQGFEAYQTSVPQPKRGPTYDPEESSPPDDTNSVDMDLNGAGTSAFLTGSKITLVTGNLSVPALPNQIRREYGQILYASIDAGSPNISLSALLEYPTAPDGDYTGSAVWTYAGYLITDDNANFQTFSYPVVQGDSIYAEIRSNGRVHSVIGQVNGRQVFNFTVVVTTNLNYVSVGTQVYNIGGCSQLPSNNVQYFENINIKDNGVARTSYNWNISSVEKVCNSTIVCCTHDCLAYWNNPSTSLTCPQVRSLYGVKPTSSVTLPPRTTPTASPTPVSTTIQPTTPVPTVTTAAPTSPTVKPTTIKPTTRKPTTRKPTTRKPTTPEPTTRKPTTRVPTTRKPTTRKPTTRKPTTAKPTSKA